MTHSLTEWGGGIYSDTAVNLEFQSSALQDNMYNRFCLVWVVVSAPNGLAVDPLSGLVYYTDAGLDIIGVLNFDLSWHRVLYRDGLQEPRAIALHPVAGYEHIPGADPGFLEGGGSGSSQRAFSKGTS